MMKEALVCMTRPGVSDGRMHQMASIMHDSYHRPGVGINGITIRPSFPGRDTGPRPDQN